MAIITISRGTFSGGKTIAEQLAKRLDYPCVSRELHHDDVREFGISEAELSAAFARPSFWKRSSTKRIAVLNAFRAALLKMCQGGDLVYHGFAGHLLLSGVSHVLRIRIIASMEYRIQAAVELCGTSYEEAVALIANDDRESSDWARFLYGVDRQDPSLYDVILNLDKVSIESVVETLVEMSKREDFKPTTESQRAFNDLLLESIVWVELFRNPRTKTADIRVEAREGRVHITGDAGDERALQDIQVVTQAISGVRDVICDVGVGSKWFW